MKIYLKIAAVLSVLITLFVIISTTASAYDYYEDFDSYFNDSECEHNFVTKNVTDYYVTFECDKCQETKSGSIPDDVFVYNVYSSDDYWFSYNSEIPEEFTPGETVTLYISTYNCDYSELEVTASDYNIVKISKVDQQYYNNVYSLEFINEGNVTINVSSKYDSSIIYETLSFKTRCEHNYVAVDTTDYVVTFECDKCQETKSGSIPDDAWLNNVRDYDESGISYSSYIQSSFTINQSITIYADKTYAEYSELEFLIDNEDILKIESIPHNYYELYSFNFIKEGIVTVAVTSKYDNNIVYDVLTFISDGYDSYLADSYLYYTDKKDAAGDIDGNGNITAADARLILRVATDLSQCNLPAKQYADADGNGKITAADARLVLRVSASLENKSVLSEFYVLDTEYYNTTNSYNNSLTISLDVGKKYSADTYIIRDADNLTYTSSNTAVATVDKSNNIVAIKKGYACITVTNGTETFTYEVFVLASGDTLDNYIYGNHDINLGINDTFSIEYVILKDTKNVKWSSSNPAVATVDSKGNVKAIKKGYACIIASNGSESCYYDVNVKNELQEKIDLYREKYPDGYYWNNHTPSKTYPNVSEQPCTDHKSKKYEYCKGQCAGFADLMFREIYGSNAKKHYGVTWDTIEIGDYIRLNPHHSIFVTDVVKKGDIIGYDKWSGKNITASETYVVVVHCNWGSCCNIAWDDVFYKDSYSINSSASYSAQ